MKNAHDVWNEWVLAANEHGHNLLEVLWAFDESENAEDVLLDSINQEDVAENFEKFLKEHYSDPPDPKAPKPKPRRYRTIDDK